MQEGDELRAALVAKAEQGDIEAQYELGWRQALGSGLPENDGDAVLWLRRAASAGHLLACNNLGARHVSGEGVDQDLIEAYRWFHLAAQKGDRKAGKNRDSIALQMTSEQVNEALRRASQE